MSIYPPISYSDYLKINELLGLQKKRSEEFGADAHDEMLFIIVHQVYELWFKQILTEINTIQTVFGRQHVAEAEMGNAVAKLDRVVTILRHLVDQISVLETMTPMDFLEFRNYLYPASGFQSVQWRLLENKLGLNRKSRLTYNSQPYTAFVSPSEKALLEASESEKSLFDLLDDWLSRTPFLQAQGFDFWRSLGAAIDDMLNDDLARIEKNQLLGQEDRERNIKQVQGLKETFGHLLDAEKYASLLAQGQFRMSHKGIQAALFISLYRDEPIFHMPFQLLTKLQDIDELMTTWRYRHALMVHRMIGGKIGTGGSAGAQYLKSATETHRIFTDLFNLSTFLIPKSRRPQLPESVRAQMNFAP